MSADLTHDSGTSGNEGPADELESAEATLQVLVEVVKTIGPEDFGRQTPCRDFDVSALTDHLLNSIIQLGKAAGATITDGDEGAPLEGRITTTARPALDAWHRRGLEGTVAFGDNQVPATLMAGILSLEFLVHAWDYAVATGGQMNAPDAVADYVLAVAKRTISPDARSQVGFDDAVSVSDQASALERLIAFTGRAPIRS